jgi:hypothetical protein
MKRRNPAISARHAAARQLQDQRREDLARLRLRRSLTDAELAEEARLEKALALRVWRDAQRAEEARIETTIAAQAARENLKENA